MSSISFYTREGGHRPPVFKWLCKRGVDGNHHVDWTPGFRCLATVNMQGCPMPLARNSHTGIADFHLTLPPGVSVTTHSSPQQNPNTFFQGIFTGPTPQPDGTTRFCAGQTPPQEPIIGGSQTAGYKRPGENAGISHYPNQEPATQADTRKGMRCPIPDMRE